MKDDLMETLLKKAKGYSKKETTAEYVIDGEGNRRLVKEKVQLKHYPPDNSALKSYIELCGSRYENYSDSELEDERLRLIKELADYSENNKKTRRKDETH